MGKKKFSVKVKPPKVRKTWGINPVERVKEDKKRYNRRKSKEELGREAKELENREA